MTWHSSRRRRIMEIKQIQINVAWADMLIVSALHTLRWAVPLAVAVMAFLCVWAHRKAKKQ